MIELLKITVILFLSWLGGFFYRKGGSDHSHTWWRDIGTSLCAVIAFGIGMAWHALLILCFALLWAAMSTYLDFLNKFLQHDEDEFWFNWVMIGITYNLAMIPIVCYFDLWTGFFIRMACLPASFLLAHFCVDLFDRYIKHLSDNNVPKEWLRGALTVATMPILWI